MIGELAWPVRKYLHACQASGSSLGPAFPRKPRPAVTGQFSIGEAVSSYNGLVRTRSDNRVGRTARPRYLFLCLSGLGRNKGRQQPRVLDRQQGRDKAGIT